MTSFANFFFFETITFLFLLTSQAVHAEENWFNTDAFPIMPRFSLAGSGASGAVIGLGDTLVPILGNPNRFIVFADAAGAYDDHNANFISPGGGLRYVKSNQILGAYFFADFTKTKGNGHFFVANPGLEWMSATWDAHINGYFPSTQMHKLRDLGLASSLGNYNFIQFKGHTQFDQQLVQYGVVGKGVDAEIGFSLPLHELRSRFYVGAYHYRPEPVQSITGGQIGFEYPINPLASIIVSGSHDNVFKTNGSITLRLTFGNSSIHFSENVGDRLVDPLPRHLGTLYTGASIPSEKLITNSGESLAVLRDIWFFLPGSTSVAGVTIEDCTIENPCVGLNQNTIHSINLLDPNAIFYFAPGQYFPLDAPPAAGILTIANGQSFWGRNTGYVTPANGSNRAVMNGVLQLSSNNILDSLQVFNNSVDENLASFGGLNKTGIHILTSTGNNYLNNMNVQVTNNALNNGALSVFTEGNTSLTINNSSFDAVDNAINSTNGAENIAILGNNPISINNSSFIASVAGDIGAFNIYNQTSTTSLLLSNNTMNAVSAGAGGAAGNVYLVGPNSSVNLNASTLTARITGPNSPQGAENIILFANNTSAFINDSILNAINDSVNGQAINVNNFSATVTVTNSNLTTTDTNGDGAIGVVSDQGGNTVINNSIINTNESGGTFTTGVFVRNAVASINQTEINATNNSNTSSLSGIFVEGASSATVTGSTMTVTQQGAGSATGARASGGTLNVLNSNFNISSPNGGTAYGVINFGTMSFVNSHFVITGNGASQFNGGANPVSVSDGTCILNGLPCP